MTTGVIPIGMIGFPDGPDQLCTALEGHLRLKLAGVYSAKYGVAESVATLMGVTAHGSLRRLLTQPGMQGAIYLETPSHAGRLRWVVQGDLKHVLLTQSALSELSPAVLAELHTLAERRSVAVLPELLPRWTPATLRLRELIATHLGPIERIELPAPKFSEEPTQRLQAACLQFDWLRSLVSVRTSVFRLHSPAIEGYGGATTAGAPAADVLEIRLSGGRAGEVLCRIGVPLPVSPAANDSPDTVVPETSVASHTPPARVQCRAGWLQIQSDAELSWGLTSGETRSERLIEERSAEEVLLDLFGRRMVGGIVPVPDLEDWLRSLRWGAIWEHLKNHGGTVQVEEHSVPIDDGKFRF